MGLQVWVYIAFKKKETSKQVFLSNCVMFEF